MTDEKDDFDFDFADITDGEADNPPPTDEPLADDPFGELIAAAAEASPETREPAADLGSFLDDHHDLPASNGNDLPAPIDDDPFTTAPPMDLGAPPTTAAPNPGDEFDFLGSLSEDGEATAEVSTLDPEGEPSEAVVEPARAVLIAAKPAVRSGLGMLIGIIGGGLLAIPLTLALLLWGLGRDPLGIARHLPTQITFLLPAKFRQEAALSPAVPPVGQPAVAEETAVASASDTPAPTTEPTAQAHEGPTSLESASAPPAAPASPSPAMDQVAVTDPASAVPGIPVAPAAAAVVQPTIGEQPQANPPTTDSEPPATAMKTAAATSSPEQSPPAEPPAAEVAPTTAPMPAAPSRAAIDTEPLTAAVESALASLDAALAADPTQTADQRKRLVSWYESLADVAEELAGLEATAGPEAAASEAVSKVTSPLFDRLVGSLPIAAELERLSGMWLSARSRSRDGGIVIAMLADTRPAGPYWYSQLTIAQPNGPLQEAVMLSRMPPAAAPGEKVVVTGVVLDDATLWASDCRPVVFESTAQPPEPGEPKPVPQSSAPEPASPF